MRLAAASIGFTLALLPFAARSQYEQTFGDMTVHYSALSTARLLPAMAKSYGIAQSASRGLVNIAIERKAADGGSAMIAATVTGSVADLTGHRRPIRFRETQDEGAIDYLGEFALDGSGTYVFTIEVTAPGRAQPYTVTFNREYVLD